MDSAIFWGWQVLDLSHFRGWPVQDSVFFWILANGENWGWQEGSATLYKIKSKILEFSSEKSFVAILLKFDIFEL